MATSIAKKGFAALASLDEGYYGKGIYFTSFCLYTIPYLTNKKEPALLISLANLGNAYPVIENHKSPETLMGAATKSGYQSHYVLTQKDGQVSQKPPFYDEIVLSQESQVVPIYIVKIPRDCSSKLNKIWNKDTGTTSPRRDKRDDKRKSGKPEKDKRKSGKPTKGNDL